MIREDFSAGGGVSEGMRLLGIEAEASVGIELKADPVATARAAGHQRWHESVTSEAVRGYNWGILDGYHASPECQTFSAAGKGAGAVHMAAYVTALELVATGVLPEVAVAQVNDSALNVSAMLSLEPMLVIYRHRPEWITLEQVPRVLPLWEAYAKILAGWGYNVWTGHLSAEQHGIVATCPLHATDPALPAERPSLEPRRLASVGAAGIATAWEGSVAIAAARRAATSSRSAVGVARHGRPGTTEDEALLGTAWTVAAISRAVLDDASDATWLALAKPLLQRALSELRTLPGRAGGMSMSEATSGLELAGLTVGSIGSLPNRLWDALCGLARSYTTSTAPSTTTPLRTSQSSAATPITSRTTVPASGVGPPTLYARDSCGACDDWATPQTRKRAILMAHKSREVAPPTPTHSRYYPRDPKRLDAGVLKWISMAEALTWSADDLVGFPRRSDGKEEVVVDGVAYRARDLRPASQPAQVLTEKARSWQRTWTPTAAVEGDTSWAYERPAVTVVGSFAPDVMAAPGYRKPGDGPRQAQPGSIRVTAQEAAVLQSFRPDYPWAGPKTSQFQQIGNAVPPLLARAVIGALLGIEISA